MHRKKQEPFRATLTPVNYDVLFTIMAFCLLAKLVLFIIILTSFFFLSEIIEIIVDSKHSFFSDS